MFRLLTATLAVAMLLSFAPAARAQEPTPTVPPLLLGDVNCDGAVSFVDAALILQFDTGLIISPLCVDGGDVNDDGNVDTLDASIILQLVRGLIDGLPPVPPEPLPPPASAAVSIGSAEAWPGQQRVVALEALDITSPGIGAWAFEVKYDPTVVSLVECFGEHGSDSVCNAEFATGVLRLSGAASGLTDGLRSVELAEPVFECITVSGMTDLVINVRTFADATVGAPQPINPTVTNGSITCGEPPLPTPRPEPTPDPSAWTDIVTVVHDLNRNGQRDPGEPGVEGWTVELRLIGGEGAFITLGSGATDAAGRFQLLNRTGGSPVPLVEERFGWIMTGKSQHFERELRETHHLVLLHKVGQQLHLLSGAVLIDGLPAPEGTSIDAVVGNASCGDSEIAVPFRINYEARYTMYVLGEADRPGCAAEGQAVGITVDGVSVADVSFASGSTGEIHLYLGPTPMWFVTDEREGPPPVAYVGSLVCGEVRTRPSGFTPLSSHTVYVFPDALRSGCGAPGRIVTLRVGDEVLRHVLWQEGFVPQDQLQDVELPVVGASAQLSGSGFSLTDAGGARIYAFVLAIAGASLLAGGTAGWRRKGAGSA